MNESPIKTLAVLDQYRRQDSARKRTKVVNKTKTSTQKKALQLLIRESSNAKSSRLASLLTRNMIKKFGTRKENTLINRKIAESVNLFLNQHPHFGESDLPALEDHVRSAREEISRNRPISSTEPSSRNSNLQGDDGSGVGSIEESGGNVGEGRRRSKVRPEEKLEANWTVLNAFKEIRDEDRFF